MTESSAKGSQSSASDRQELPVTVKPEESPTLSSLLVSSPEDADPPNEGFLTPSEDVAQLEAVSAELPASVPLPGSFHDTPPVATSVVPDETNKTSTEPEPEPEAPRPESSKPAEPVESLNPEYAQPRPRPPSASIVQPVSPPSRSGSPGAPPLPRRAAARRAVPRPPAAPPAPASPPPAADVRQTEIVVQPNGHHVEQTEAHATTEPDAKANIIPTPVVAPESDPPPSSSSEEPGNPPKEKDEEETKEGQADVLLPAAETTESAVPETSTAEEEFVDVAGEAVELNSDQPDEKPEQQQQQQPQLPPRRERPLSADSSTPHGDGDATVETSAEGAGSSTANDQDAEPSESPRALEKMKMTAIASEDEATAAPRPPLPPPRHPRPPPVRSTEQRRALSESPTSSSGNMGVGKSDKSGKPVEPEYALDGMPYVGDGTWEERTWKELTRLREDMFWARVGSAQ